VLVCSEYGNETWDSLKNGECLDILNYGQLIENYCSVE
jgi:hypothetical protein